MRSSADPADAAPASVRRVLLLTLVLNLAVSAAKLVVGTTTGSLAMVADGYHSTVDGLNNVIGLVVTAFAYAPPDRGHPYGHRKFETSATLAIGLALLAIAYRVVSDALQGLLRAHLPAIGLANWAVMAGTLAVNLFVSVYEDREGRRLGSAYLRADAAHTRSDLLVSLGVTTSFIGAHLRLAWADGLIAAAIAGFIGFLAVRILLSAFDVLTDRAVIPAESIVPVVLTVSGVRECREVRSRGDANAVYVDLVVRVNGGMTLREAHDIADRVEEALSQAYPQIVDALVHVEPVEEAP